MKRATAPAMERATIPSVLTSLGLGVGAAPTTVLIPPLDEVGATDGAKVVPLVVTLVSVVPFKKDGAMVTNLGRVGREITGGVGPVIGAGVTGTNATGVGVGTLVVGTGVG
eukprot:CAMPEP_0116543278 /NCGR_PEP_ID=MMETSP0397-20121206/1469_1 /TAXON_ID=216820 /ORGANISM="Cyclophora tenuis, Strain ECT3854" /LENGTH=110 /DNA_ID=CAMNT_0004067353 /DNA_START=214 /DNA_END=546 /DNA_ORIENTATION=+